MTSTAARYPIKPKTLTLLELCQSFHDFRFPPPSISSYQCQLAPNTARALTRRVYLHPLTLNVPSKQQSSKSSNNSRILSHSEQCHPLNSNKYREMYHIKNKSSDHGLVILSSSLPLMTRINGKSDPRHCRDKSLKNVDDDSGSDYDASTTTISLNQASFLSIARGTSSSTRTMCTRPACVMNHQKFYAKSNRFEKVNVWHHIDQVLERPMPNDPPTTPHNAVLGFNLENDERKGQHSNYSSVQEVKIYKRNSARKLIINQVNDDDDDDDDKDNNDHHHQTYNQN